MREEVSEWVSKCYFPLERGERGMWIIRLSVVNLGYYYEGSISDMDIEFEWFLF